MSGLVREALWAYVIARNDSELAATVVVSAEALTTTVESRVELGDLPQSDLLLAQSEVMGKQVLMIEAEARVADAGRRYESVTGMDRIPVSFIESEPSVQEISSEHPTLVAAILRVDRGAAERDVVAITARENPSVLIGPRRERGERSDPWANSFGLTFRMPIGGRAQRNVALSAAERARTEALAEQLRIARDLELALHEAQHELETARRVLLLADQRRSVSNQHLNMMHRAFDAGETDLIDLLRIQANTNAANREAAQRLLEQQRALCQA